MDLIVLNATSQAITAISIDGQDVSDGQGIPALFGPEGELQSKSAGLRVKDFSFNVEVVARFYSGATWRQRVNEIGMKPPVMLLFCYANGYLLSLPDGTIKQAYSQALEYWAAPDPARPFHPPHEETHDGES